MQLVAYGAQDIYLTGNPQITFFKVVYRRHTNFSMEDIQQTINGSSELGGGNKGTVTISRNGDLVSDVYVRQIGGAQFADSWRYAIREVELEIGGQRIDRHDREWMEIWNEISTPHSKAIGLRCLTGQGGQQGTDGCSNIYIPLRFWFCRNPGLALPLIALQYHEVKLKFTWGEVQHSKTVNAEVWCKYIYLDTDERRRFAQVSHEYLIEQVQLQKENKTATSFKLNFNHPIKELLWTTSPAGDSNAFRGSDVLKLQLNGHDRFANQYAEYFQIKQMLDHHTAVPTQNLPWGARDNAGGATIPVRSATAAVASSEEAINSPDLAKSKELEATAGAVKSGGALSKQATQVHVQKLVFGSPAVTGADAKFNLSRTAAGAGVLVISSGLQTETPCRSGDYILGLFYDDSENEINQIVAHVAGCVPTTMEVNGLSAMWTITLDHGHFDHAAAATGDIIGFMTIPASALKHRDIHLSLIHI